MASPATSTKLDALLLWLVPDGLDAAIKLVVPNEVALQRLATRARIDDTTPVIRERLEGFERETTPLLCRLEAEGLLVSIDADRPINEVTEALFDSFRKHGRPTDAISLPTYVD